MKSKTQNKMKFKLIFFLFIIQSILISGHSTVISDDIYNKSSKRSLISAITKERTIKFAKLDIENGIPNIFLKSGIAPIVFSTDSIFENKYVIKYNEEGCGGADIELAKLYNHEIYDYLLIKYGKDWILEIRQDAIGLKAWKRKNNK